MPRPAPLAETLKLLRAKYGKPKPLPRGPWEWVLWENVVYLADDGVRATAFESLRDNTKLDPEAIIDADDDALLLATSTGILAPLQAGKLRECAAIVLDDFDGDLDRVLSWPEKKALAALKKFPGLGTPGAEKILMFEHVLPVLALDSNGLRVMLRLGFGKEEKAYAASYKSVREAIAKHMLADFDALIAAHCHLRQLGQEVCTRNKPNCAACELKKLCPTGRGAA